MSLRGFHLLFILISTLMCFGISYLFGFQSTGAVFEQTVATVSGVAGIILAVYGARFYIKTRRLHL